MGLNVFGLLSLVRRYEAWCCSCCHEDYHTITLYSFDSGWPIWLNPIFTHGEWVEIVEQRQRSTSQNHVGLLIAPNPIYRSTLSDLPNAAPPPSRISPLTMIHHISHRYMTPAALLFSLYSSKLPVPPSAVAPSSPFLSLSVFASHSSSSAAMICSNRCCWPLAR